MFRVLTRDLSSIQLAQVDSAADLIQKVCSYGRPIIPYALWAAASCRAPMRLWKNDNLRIHLSKKDILALVEDMGTIVPDLRDENNQRALLKLCKFVSYYTLLCHLVSQVLETGNTTASSPSDAHDSDDQGTSIDYRAFVKPFYLTSQAFNTEFRRYLVPDWKPLFEEYSYAELCLQLCTEMNAKFEGMVCEEIFEPLKEISNRRSSS